MSVIKRSPLAAVTDDDDPLMRAFATSPPLSPTVSNGSTSKATATSPSAGTGAPNSAVSSSSSSAAFPPSSSPPVQPTNSFLPPSMSSSSAASSSLFSSSSSPSPHRSAAASVTSAATSAARGLFSAAFKQSRAAAAPAAAAAAPPSAAASSNYFLPPSITSSSAFPSSAPQSAAEADSSPAAAPADAERFAREDRRRREREGTVRPSAIASFSSTPNPLTPAHNGLHLAATAIADSQQPAPAASGPLLLPYQDYTQVSDELMLDYVDDWESHGNVPGEKLVMKIECVFYYRDADSVATNTPMQSQHVAARRQFFDPLSLPAANTPTAAASTAPAPVYTPPTQISHDDRSTVIGTLVMTSYQLYLEPISTQAERLSHPVIDGVIAIPLSTIEKLVMEPPRGQLHILDLYGKDGRTVRFGFGSQTFAKRAFDCLNMYIFPSEDSLLFAYYYKPKHPVPPHLNGWNIYNPIAEYRRLGIPSKSLRLCRSNKDYHLSTSYPALLVMPAEQYFSDAELEAVAHFRSRGRVPACTWLHPNGRQSIWRCSQPRVGVNNARCAEDEKLISAISVATGVRDICIFDCRPRMNAQANRLAGKGFESSENYRNSRVCFMNIENIHAMRQSFQKLVKACQQDVHSADFAVAVASSQWLLHVGLVLKATFQMVLAVDRDKQSILSHCSDGWDRTSQLVSLTELCLDPYYRSLEGFVVLVEKDWLAFGHQFAKRTGHRENKASDEQRSPIFLQWCDCVYQLTQQFPRHFEFNSHFLVTLMSHLYSCRFGTFFLNTEMMRRKTKLAQQTVSLWTYFMCSPAACRGEFTNPLYAPSGCGTGEAISDWPVFKSSAAVYAQLNKSHLPHHADAALPSVAQPAKPQAAAPTAGTAEDGEAATAASEANGADRSQEKEKDSAGSAVVNAPADASAPAGIVTAASTEADEPKPTADAAASASAQEIQPPLVTEERERGEKEEKEEKDGRQAEDGSEEAETEPDADPLLRSDSFNNKAGSGVSSSRPAPAPATAPATASAAAATAAPAASVRSSSVTSVDEPPSPRKTSLGRGGGDGSGKSFAGSVLYPSFSLKKLQLWSDWFLRWHGDQAEHSSAFGPLGPGSIPPGGAATTHFVTNDALYQSTVRKLVEERWEQEDARWETEEQLRRLEAEARELKARLDRAGLSSDVSGLSVERPQRPVREKPARAVRVSDVSRLENALMEDEPDLSNVQEEADNPEDKAADV